MRIKIETLTKQRDWYLDLPGPEDYARFALGGDNYNICVRKAPKPMPPHLTREEIKSINIVMARDDNASSSNTIPEEGLLLFSSRQKLSKHVRPDRFDSDFILRFYKKTTLPFLTKQKNLSEKELCKTLIRIIGGIKDTLRHKINQEAAYWLRWNNYHLSSTFHFDRTHEIATCAFVLNKFGHRTSRTINFKVGVTKDLQIDKDTLESLTAIGTKGTKKRKSPNIFAPRNWRLEPDGSIIKGVSMPLDATPEEKQAMRLNYCRLKRTKPKYLRYLSQRDRIDGTYIFLDKARMQIRGRLRYFDLSTSFRYKMLDWYPEKRIVIALIGGSVFTIRVGKKFKILGLGRLHDTK